MTKLERIIHISPGGTSLACYFYSYPLCAQQESATQEQLMLKTKEPHQEYRAVLEGVKPELKMKPGEPQKQMMQLVDIQTSDTGLLKEVLSHDYNYNLYTYTSFHMYMYMCMPHPMCRGSHILNSLKEFIILIFVRETQSVQVYSKHDEFPVSNFHH